MFLMGKPPAVFCDTIGVARRSSLNRGCKRLKKKARDSSLKGPPMPALRTLFTRSQKLGQRHRRRSRTTTVASPSSSLGSRIDDDDLRATAQRQRGQCRGWIHQATRADDQHHVQRAAPASACCSAATSSISPNHTTPGRSQSPQAGQRGGSPAGDDRIVFDEPAAAPGIPCASGCRAARSAHCPREHATRRHSA